MRFYPTPEQHRKIKPRKAFQKAPRLYFPYPDSNYETRGLGSWRDMFNIPKKIDIPVKIILSICLVTILFFIFSVIKGSEQYMLTWHSNQTNYISTIKTTRRKHHYKILIHSAHFDLKHDRKRYAARSFLKAYELNNDGHEAALGLTELLVHDCSKYNSHCELAEQWIIFCKIQFGGSEKIKEWERQLTDQK